MLRTLLTIRKISGRPRGPSSLLLLLLLPPRHLAGSGARGRVTSESAGQLERESVPIEIDSIESSPRDPYFYRHAALCSAERIAKRRVRASMRPEIIRFSLPRSPLQINRKRREERARPRVRRSAR